MKLIGSRHYLKVFKKPPKNSFEFELAFKLLLLSPLVLSFLSCLAHVFLSIFWNNGRAKWGRKDLVLLFWLIFASSSQQTINAYPILCTTSHQLITSCLVVGGLSKTFFPPFSCMHMAGQRLPQEANNSHANIP